MKKIILSFILFCCTWYGMYGASLNGTITDGWLMVEDFEDYTLGFALSVSSVDISAVVQESPLSSQAAYLSGSNNNHYFTINAILPVGTVLSDFESLSIDLYMEQASYKNLEIWINGTKVHSAGNLINSNNTNLGTKTFAFSSFSESGAASVITNAGNNVVIGIGSSRMNSTTFYVDNIKLYGENINIPTNVFTATLNPGTGTSSASITETAEGLGVTLPSAIPSAKCAVAGWTFAGWSESSVTETSSLPTLIPIGNYAISENITLYAVYTDGVLYNSNPNCSGSLNGTVDADGWLMLEDFEDYALDFALSVSSVDISAVVQENPLSSQAAYLSGSNNNHYFTVNVTLPAGTVLSDFESLSIDLYMETASFKNLEIWINGVKVHSVSNLINNNNTNLGTKTFAFSSFSESGAASAITNAGNNVVIGIGSSRMNSTTFYVDNIKLYGENINIPINVFTATFNPGSGTCESASVTETAEGSGVILPSAVPSSKCAAAGWSFAGWSESDVTETTVTPTLILAGNYAITENITLYAVYSDGTLYNSTPNCSGSLNGTVDADGWLMLEDFEDAEIGSTYTLYRRYEGSPSTVPVEAAPGSEHGNAIHVTTGNWDQYLELTVTLPCERTLADYTHIGFDIYRVSDDNNNFIVGIDKNPTSDSNCDISENFSTGAAWQSKSFAFTNPTSGNTFTLRIGYRTGSGNYYLDNIKLKEKDGLEPCNVTEVTWVGGTTGALSDWETAANWNPKKVPDATIDVIIPGDVTNFPVLTNAAACKNITFQPGAELGRQDLLNVAGEATVKMNLETLRYYMLSMPMNVPNLDAFYLEKDPEVWFKEFAVKDNKADWDYIIDVETAYPAGTGFTYFIDDLNSNQESVYADQEISLIGSIVEDSDLPISTPLDFGLDGGIYFSLAGNPFMSTIDFDALQGVNSSIITNNYLVWTASGFVGYPGVGGSFGPVIDGTAVPGATDAANRKIPPLQAFIVESTSGTSGEIEYDMSIQSTGTSTAGLRSAKSADADKLNIVASNETASVLTFIANRPDGQSARKLLMSEFSYMPDVYTLADDGKTALGANIINASSITIPIGIATTHSGDMSLTFSGMEDYDAKIKLFDTQEDDEIDLTGKSSYQYDFDYTAPTNAADQIIADESRFYLTFSPKNILGEMNVNDAVGENTLVYAKNNTIYAISPADNPIQQIFVYDIQGRTIYAETNLNTPVFYVNGLQSDITTVLVKVITEKGVKNVKLINK